MRLFKDVIAKIKVNFLKKPKHWQNSVNKIDK